MKVRHLQALLNAEDPDAELVIITTADHWDIVLPETDKAVWCSHYEPDNL